MATLGTFTSGQVLTASELNQLNNVTALRDTSTLSIATTTVTAINFGAGTEIVDAGGWHSTSTNTDRITPTVAGVYLVIAYGSVESAAFGASSRLYVAITKNNTLHTNANIGSPSYPAASCSAIIDLNGTTDWVNMQIFQDSGSSLNSVRRALSVMLLRKS